MHLLGLSQIGFLVLRGDSRKTPNADRIHGSVGIGPMKKRGQGGMSHCWPCFLLPSIRKHCPEPTLISPEPQTHRLQAAPVFNQEPESVDCGHGPGRLRGPPVRVLFSSPPHPERRSRPGGTAHVFSKCWLPTITGGRDSGSMIVWPRITLINPRAQLSAGRPTSFVRRSALINEENRLGRWSATRRRSPAAGATRIAGIRGGGRTKFENLPKSP
jgi:hypothetical protein